MNLDWSAQQINLCLTPKGKPLGRKKLEASVFTLYSDNIKVRFVQELCGLIGGDVVYCYASPSSRLEPEQTLIPITNWRSPDLKRYLGHAADYIYKWLDIDTPITIFGSDRSEYALSISSKNNTTDVIDNGPDNGDKVDNGHVEREANGLRLTF